MVANKWAESRSNWLLRRDEGLIGLEREMRWTVQDSVRNDSFLLPLSTRFSHGVALIQTGHAEEARKVLRLAQAIAGASVEYDQDNGGAMSAVLRATFLTYLYCCRWLLDSDKDLQYLAQAVNHLDMAVGRAQVAGLEIGDDAFEELALLHVILGDGDKAVEAVARVSGEPVPFHPATLIQGTPTTRKTLALASTLVSNLAGTPTDDLRMHLEEGVRRAMQEQFRKTSPHTRTLLLWLDLPNVLFGRQGDPWAMLAQINEMVGE